MHLRQFLIINSKKQLEMNILQKSKLNMYMVVNNLLNAAAAIVETLPNQRGIVTTVKDNTTQIQEVAELQEFDKSGLSDKKKLLRASLIEQAEDISLKMVAYATNISNSVLLKEVKYPKSELSRAADTDLKNMVQCIYDRTNENIRQLTEYGITEEMLANFLTTINSFNESIPTVRKGVSSKKLYTAKLDNLFKSTDAALDKLDKIVEIVRLTQPDFYKEYQTSRMIINTAAGSVALKGVVVDAANLEPLKGAVLTIAPEASTATLSTNNDDSSIVKRTAGKGGFLVKSLPEGTYSVTISKNGYKDQVLSVAITDGELSNLNIKLLRN
ncbi:hypothetical protein CYCD_22480 [Tenuifilaceae bacterium CYCD]|nr:hypothetical protein CYCD_22480 [Tenuifilaceae bacterium CYCD]